MKTQESIKHCTSKKQNISTNIKIKPNSLMRQNQLQEDHHLPYSRHVSTYVEMELNIIGLVISCNKPTGETAT